MRTTSEVTMERGRRRRALEFWQQVLSCFRGQKSVAQEAHFGHFYLSVASVAAQGASNRQRIHH